MATAARKAASAKSQKWNRQVSVNNFLKNFKTKFDMKEDAIDLREMAKNYPGEIIPLDDILQAIVAVVGPKFSVAAPQYDPSGGAVIHYPNPDISPRFTYIDWGQAYLWSIFQRDVAPNHVEKIYRDFDRTAVIVPCAIKITTSDGKEKFCIWDGHHTMQVCRLMGYNKFPVWYIDLDSVTSAELDANGFEDSDDGRIRYGAFVAGTNMRRINGKNKRPLAPYDDFMIGYETRDPQYVAMMQILKKNSCVPKRHATAAGSFTQIKSGIECYELEDSNGVKGRFWDRALRLHRANWPDACLELEVFRALSYLYQLADIQGYQLPPDFDAELAAMLIKKYGDAEGVQLGVKKSFWEAYEKSAITGQIPDLDKDRVLNGLINLYVQNKGKYQLPAPVCRWKV